MIQTSSEFKKAVYALSRRMSCKIRFEILDLTAFEDNTKAVTSQASISRLSQVTNKVRKMSSNYAVFEKDYLKLDGSFIIPPIPTQLIDYELGWWSNALSNETGDFIPYQVLEFDFNSEHSNLGVTIYFDMLNGEYATKFDIDAYDASNKSIEHQEITDNTDSRYICLLPLNNYKKIVITVKQWCKPYRRLKIAEVDFGVVKEYTDDDLISMSLIQELDTTSSTVPADELQFTVDNTSREFNILNPDGFYAYLKSGQEVFMELGTELDNGELEFIQVGKYYLREWQTDNDAYTATFTARDLIDSLSSDNTESSTERNMTLYNLAVETLKANDISDYVLSDNLKLITTKALYSQMSYRDLLQLISIAGMCVIYTDNAGTLHLKQLLSAKSVLNGVSVTSEASISNKDQLIDNILEPSFKIETLEKNRLKLDGSFEIPKSDMTTYQVGWISGDITNSNGVFENEQIIELTTSREHSSESIEILFDMLNNEYATEFDIKAYDALGNAIFTETISNNTLSDYLYQNTLIAKSRKIDVIIKFWCKPYSRAKISEITFDAPVDTIDFDNTYSEPQIALSGIVKSVVVTYYPTDLDNSVTCTYTDSSVRTGDILTIDNSLINTENDALNVAKWILEQSNQFATFSIDWRQNPRLTLADKVSIENSFTTPHMAVITKQQYNYEGYLSGGTEAKGAI